MLARYLIWVKSQWLELCINFIKSQLLLQFVLLLAGSGQLSGLLFQLLVKITIQEKSENSACLQH